MSTSDPETNWRAAVAELAQVAVAFDALTAMLPPTVEPVLPEPAQGVGLSFAGAFANGNDSPGTRSSADEAANGHTDASLGDITASLERDLAQAAGGVRDLDAFADDVLSELDALAEALAALTEDGQRCAAAILRQQSSVSSALDEFGDAVSEEHEAATEASLAQSTNTVSEALTSSLDGAMDGLGAAIDSEVDGFVGEAMGLGTDLDHTWSSALSSVATEIRDTLVGRIKEGALRAVSNGVQALAQDVAEAALTTTLGSQITAALGPALPALVAAKTAAKAINALKGVFGL